MTNEIVAGAETGVGRIARERFRQVRVKGWTMEHDRTEHADGSLGELAQMVLHAAIGGYGPDEVEDDEDEGWVVPACVHILEKWPDPVRRLEIAGALIAAEIDRLAASATYDVTRG